jgi:C-terminal processing protease CtpA/Prc
MFGVIAYQCASCVIRMYESGNVYEFQTEPVIMEVASGSKLLPGDVIVAVNDAPILTSAGAQLFSNPAKGDYHITVRRAGQQVRVGTPTLLCPAQRAEAVARLLRQFQNRLQGFDSTSSFNAYNTRGPGRFGFAVACATECGRARTPFGEVFWKWSGPPLVVSVNLNSPALHGGLQAGDRILEVNDVSILTDEGALLFAKALTQDKVRLTVLRAGKVLAVSLSIPR